MKIFYHLITNNALAALANLTIWFALTFFVYLETKSVFASGTIGGLYLVFVALSGIWFGSLVDHHRKKTMFLLSSLSSLLFFILAFIIFLVAPDNSFTSANSLHLWLMSLFILLGVVAGNIRFIAIMPLITLLVPEDKRAQANGLAGVISGLSFGTVSVISGLLIAYIGMQGVFLFTFALTIIPLLHLFFISVPEKEIIHLEDTSKKIDLKGTFRLVSRIPGLTALIIFTTFNNFLGGAFMALMDPYGLSMVSVEKWGFILGILSFSFIIGGSAIARWGLGKNPLRAMMLANLVIWASCAFFTVQPWLWLLVLGMFIYMGTFPFIEAAEQTVIQKIVPVNRQGRVFGFAQSVEQAASPLTAFLVAPLTQFLVMPFMSEGGLGADVIGDWFGVGPDRAIALVFTITGIFGFLVTLLAFRSRQYRVLSEYYLKPTTEKE